MQLLFDKIKKRFLVISTIILALFFILLIKNKINHRTKIEALIEKAEAGDINAIRGLTIYYWKTQNDKEEIYWLAKASAAGDDYLHGALLQKLNYLKEIWWEPLNINSNQNIEPMLKTPVE